MVGLGQFCDHRLALLDRCEIVLRVKVMDQLVEGTNDLLIPELCIVGKVIKSVLFLSLAEGCDELVHLHR